MLDFTRHWQEAALALQNSLLLGKTLQSSEELWPEPEDGRVDLHHLSTKKREEKHCESICVNTQTGFS